MRGADWFREQALSLQLKVPIRGDNLQTAAFPIDDLTANIPCETYAWYEPQWPPNRKVPGSFLSISTINPHYTFDYSQPEEYHFSHDSVFLARRVFELSRDRITPEMRVLDLCAGCGIVGLDFLFHCWRELNVLPRSCDFIEVQSSYESHFVHNARAFEAAIGHKRTGTELNFIEKNYVDCRIPEFAAKYDLILCNPPYFRTDQGKLSPSSFKNRCRFFIDSDFENLLLGVQHLLAPQGSAFVLMRQLADHGRDTLNEAQSHLNHKYSLAVVDQLRGTPLVEICNRG